MWLLIVVCRLLAFFSLDPPLFRLNKKWFACWLINYFTLRLRHGWTMKRKRTEWISKAAGVYLSCCVSQGCKERKELQGELFFSFRDFDVFSLHVREIIYEEKVDFGVTHLEFGDIIFYGNLSHVQCIKASRLWNEVMRFEVMGCEVFFSKKRFLSDFLSSFEFWNRFGNLIRKIFCTKNTKTSHLNAQSMLLRPLIALKFTFSFYISRTFLINLQIINNK